MVGGVFVAVGETGVGVRVRVAVGRGVDVGGFGVGVRLAITTGVTGMRVFLGIVGVMVTNRLCVSVG